MRKKSMEKMVSFDPSEVIFLLNKWDSLIFSDEEPEDVVFNNILRKLEQLWGTVTGRNVLKFAAGRVCRIATCKCAFSFSSPLFLSYYNSWP